MQNRQHSLSQILGTNISDKRKKLGLTQEELSEMLDISQQSLSRIEQGHIAPRFERLTMIADALHCTVPELFLKEPHSPYIQTEKICALQKEIAQLPPSMQSDLLDIFRKILSLTEQNWSSLLPENKQNNTSDK